MSGEKEFKERIKEIARLELKNGFTDNLMETLNSAFIFKYVETLEQERNNYKELYEKEKGKWEALKHKTIDLFNRSQDVCYLNVLEIMQEIERL